MIEFYDFQHKLEERIPIKPKILKRIYLGGHLLRRNRLYEVYVMEEKLIKCKLIHEGWK